MTIAFLIIFIATFIGVVGWQKHELSGATPKHKAIAISILGAVFMAYFIIWTP